MRVRAKAKGSRPGRVWRGRVLGSHVGTRPGKPCVGARLERPRVRAPVGAALPLPGCVPRVRGSSGRPLRPFARRPLLRFPAARSPARRRDPIPQPAHAATRPRDPIPQPARAATRPRDPIPQPARAATRSRNSISRRPDGNPARTGLWLSACSIYVLQVRSPAFRAWRRALRYHGRQTRSWKDGG